MHLRHSEIVARMLRSRCFCAVDTDSLSSRDTNTSCMSVAMDSLSSRDTNTSCMSSCTCDIRTPVHQIRGYILPGYCRAITINPLVHCLIHFPDFIAFHPGYTYCRYYSTLYTSMMTTPGFAASKRIALINTVLFSQLYLPLGAVKCGVVRKYSALFSRIPGGTM